MREALTLTIEVHEENGTFWGQVKEYPGCFVTGDTLDELIGNLPDALSVHLDTEIQVRRVEEIRPQEQRLRVDLVTA